MKTQSNCFKKELIVQLLAKLSTLLAKSKKPPNITYIKIFKQYFVVHLF